MTDARTSSATPQQLKFELLRPIEAALGRRRPPGPHPMVPIDLDLVIYEDRRLSEPGLVLPDPDILTRAYLAIPLAELAPELRLPGTALSIAELAARFDPTELELLPPLTEKLRALLSQPR